MYGRLLHPLDWSPGKIYSLLKSSFSVQPFSDPSLPSTPIKQKKKLACLFVCLFCIRRLILIGVIKIHWRDMIFCFAVLCYGYKTIAPKIRLGGKASEAIGAPEWRSLQTLSRGRSPCMMDEEINGGLLHIIERSFFWGGGPLRHSLHIAWTTVNKNLPYGGRESERASHIRVAKMRMETAGKCHDQSTRETWEFSGLKRQDSQKSAPPVTPLPPQPSHLVILFSEGTKEITL